MKQVVKHERITFRVSKQLREELFRVAAQDQRKLSDWIQLQLASIVSERKSKAQVA